jgi:UDP-glucose 4-epimerase
MRVQDGFVALLLAAMAANAQAMAGMPTSLSPSTTQQQGKLPLSRSAQDFRLNQQLGSSAGAESCADLERLRGGAASKGTVLVTGGAGYIGTHCAVSLIAAGYEVMILDNFCNSSPKSLERVAEITGVKIENCFHVDIRDSAALDKVFSENKIDSVIHCAGLKAVGESVREPISYYENNFVGALNLIKSMGKNGCKSIVFSSSACVYGNPHKVPITEDFPLSCTNPYGRTKLFIEEMLRDVAKADPEWKIINLRYFNPVGAHPSGKIGEDPSGIPNNLMPYVAKVAVGKLEKLTVFGDDYPTPDGTGVRDYIHVMDLAEGHVAAVDKLPDIKGEVVYNLGTGHGYSVLDMVKAMKDAAGKEIPYSIGPRRPGDVASCYADPAKAKKELGWEAVKGVKEMCEDTWQWQSANPNGYRDP